MHRNVNSTNYYINIAVADKNPTYGEIIDLFEACENKAPGDILYFTSAFKSCYPLINIERPGRFYDTVLRIVAPTHPSIRSSSAKIIGTQLVFYRKRIWIPRIRAKGIGMCAFICSYIQKHEIYIRMYPCNIEI